MGTSERHPHFVVVLEFKKRDLHQVGDFLTLIQFCVSLSLKTWKHFFTSTISFLKLCANWVHVSLGIVNSYSFVSLNVLVYCFRNLLEKSEVEQP
jgi:hypothetical protein